MKIFNFVKLKVNRYRSQSRMKKIEEISDTFCIAKWKQVTIDLFHGQTHSCHHPIRHSININDLESNPAALHNTKKKIIARDSMIKGERPSECSYCWKIEDTDTNLRSDRLIKSAEDWAYPFRNSIIKTPLDPKISPSYLEVMFDNKCNFSCAYCMASVSSNIKVEMDRFGLYPVKNDQYHRAYGEETNSDSTSYLEAFWRWFPTIQDELHVFRVTGGEPLLSADTKKAIDYLLKNPNKKLTFAINTNLCIGEKIFESYLNSLKLLVDKKSIKLLQVFTSFDSVSNQAEYIRFGLEYNFLITNIKKISNAIPKAEIRIMTTFSILSIPKFYEFVSTVVEMRESGIDIEFDISYLSEPRYLRANIGDHKVIKMFSEQVKLIEKNLITKNLLKRKEVLKIERTFRWADSTFSDPENISYRKDFYSFINEYDKRKNLNFDNTFPELVEFKESIASMS